MTDQEESKRISVQVSSLSTQLIESIDRQSQLEDQLLNAKKIIANQKTVVDSYNELKSELERVKEDYERDKHVFEANQQKYIEAEEKVNSLNREIEDLTSSLFAEANDMVVNARKEKNEVEVLNQKLKEQLKEKDLLFDTLYIQLKNLKNVIYKLENEHNVNNLKRTSLSDSAMSSTLSVDKASTHSCPTQDFSQIQDVLFSPQLHSLRYDIPLYSEYLKFLAALPTVDTIQQTMSVSKLLRRLINYEITPVLRLDSASGIGWLLKRNLIGLMMDGLVSIEPISGINETYRTANFSPIMNTNMNNIERDNHLFSRPINSPPVAILQPCAFCSEERNDILEHGRLYVLKTSQKLENGQVENTNQFPICHYCLLKFRQVCELFAFLRSLKAGVWNLEKISLSSISQGQVSNFSSVSSPIKQKSKRLSIFNNLKPSQSSSIVVGQEFSFSDRNGLPMTNVQRSWVRLSQLRASLLWSHIGVWSIDDAVQADLSPLDINHKQEPHEELALGLSNIPDISLPTIEDETFNFERVQKPSISEKNSVAESISDKPDNETNDEVLGLDINSNFENESKIEIEDQTSLHDENGTLSIDGTIISKEGKSHEESIHNLLHSYDIENSTDEEGFVNSLSQDPNVVDENEYAEMLENTT